MPDSSPDLAKATLRGTFWTYASFYSGKLMVFLSTVILARLLVEEEFGVAGYATVVISFLEVLSDLGIGPALIYHRDNPKARITAFWLNIGIGILLFLVTFFGAPLVGSFFQDPRAVPVTRALALVFPISALGSIHDTLLRKELSFGRKFIPDFVKAISKGLASIILALLGFGAWSLIIGQIVGRALSVVVLWRIMPWRPSFQFAKSLVRPLLSYGLNIVSVDALGITLNNADYLLVGRFLGAAALGVYTVAFRFPDLLVMQFCDVISKVIFPVYARMREDPQALQRGFLTTTRYVSLVTVPMGLGMALDVRDGRLHIDLQTRGGTHIGPFVAGLTTSVSNPYWFLWWATFGLSWLLRSMDRGVAGVLAFFTGHILADLLWYLLVAFLVVTGKRFISNRAYKYVILGCGTFLLILGARFVGDGLFHLL